MLDMSSFPRCADRLKWNNTRHDDPAMNHYWAAVIVASYCHDEALTELGGFNFDDKSDGNGRKLLARLEQCIRAGRHKYRFACPSSLASLIGSRGIASSALKSKSDFILAASVLFSPHIPQDIAFDDLVDTIKAIPKAARKQAATRNIRFILDEWLSSSRRMDQPMRSAA